MAPRGSDDGVTEVVATTLLFYFPTIAAIEQNRVLRLHPRRPHTTGKSRGISAQNASEAFGPPVDPAVDSACIIFCLAVVCQLPRGRLEE